MFKFNNYINCYLLTLVGLIALFNTKAAWSSEDVCKVARQSYKLEYLSKFEQLIEKESDLNNIDCDGLNLFEAAYSSFESRRYVSDVRPARFDNLIFLIEHGYNVNKTGNNDNTPLHMSAKKGDINLIYYLVENGADIDAKNNSDNTPLIEAISSVTFSSNLETVNLLLHLDPKQNYRQHQENAFGKAIPYKVEVVRLLLQHGLYPSSKQYEAVKRYAQQGEVDRHKAQAIVSLINEYQGKRIESILSENNPQRLLFAPPPAICPQLLPPKKESSIIKAIRNNNSQKVKQLISQQVDLNSIDSSGTPALHLAIALGHKEISKSLIEAGANITLQNAKGQHPLLLVSTDSKLTELLLEKGAPVDQKSAKSKITALISSNSISVSKLLLDWGADINYQTEYGSTPLSYAIEQKNPQLFQFLLKRRANINKARTDRETLLELAVKSNQPEIVRFLLNKVSNEEKNKAYDLAILKGNMEISEILRQSGANSHDREKLFDEAVENNDINLVRRLLNEGMNKYLATKEGSSNFVRSIQYADLEMTKLLIENMSETYFKQDDRERIVSSLLPIVIQSYYEQPIEAVDFLLKNGADVNLSDSYGRTPLYLTIERPVELMTEIFLPPALYQKEEQRTANESLAIIKLLLNAGADTNVTTKIASIEELLLSLRNNGGEIITEYANNILVLFQQYN